MANLGAMAEPVAPTGVPQPDNPRGPSGLDIDLDQLLASCQNAINDPTTIAVVPVIPCSQAGPVIPCSQAGPKAETPPWKRAKSGGSTTFPTPKPMGAAPKAKWGPVLATTAKAPAMVIGQAPPVPAIAKAEAAAHAATQAEANAASLLHAAPDVHTSMIHSMMQRCSMPPAQQQLLQPAAPHAAATQASVPTHDAAPHAAATHATAPPHAAPAATHATAPAATPQQPKCPPPAWVPRPPKYPPPVNIMQVPPPPRAVVMQVPPPPRAVASMQAPTPPPPAVLANMQVPQPPRAVPPPPPRAVDRMHMPPPPPPAVVIGKAPPVPGPRPRRSPRSLGENSQWHTCWHIAKQQGAAALRQFYIDWPRPAPAKKQ